MMTSIYAIRVLCSIKSMQVTNSLNSKFTFCHTTPILYAAPPFPFPPLYVFLSFLYVSYL